MPTPIFSLEEAARAGRGIDVSRLRYDVIAILPNGTPLSLAPVLTGLQWEEQQDEVAQRVQIEFWADAHIPDGRRLHDALSYGTMLILRADWGQGWYPIIDHLVIFSDEIDSASQVAKRTAYDPLIYLQRSKWEKVYPEGTTGTTIIREILESFQVPIGRIDGPNVTLNQFTIRDQLTSSIHDVISRSWYEDTAEPPSEYTLRWNNKGGADCVLVGTNNPVYWFSSAFNVSGGSHKGDIHDVITQVQIVASGSDMTLLEDINAQGDTTPNELTEGLYPGMDDPKIKQYGLLREIVKGEESADEDNISDEAERILEERGLPHREQELPELPDVPFLRKGDLVRVDLPRIGMEGHHLVSGVVHNARQRTMKLTFDNSGTRTARTRKLKTKSAPYFLHEDPLPQVPATPKAP